MCFEAMDLHTTLGLNSNPVDSSHTGINETINCPVSRADMNEPNTQRTAL